MLTTLEPSKPYIQKLRLDLDKIPPTFVSTIFKLGNHITKKSQCENCFHDAVDFEMKRRKYSVDFESKVRDGWPFKQDRDSNEKEEE